MNPLDSFYFKLLKSVLCVAGDFKNEMLPPLPVQGTAFDFLSIDCPLHRKRPSDREALIRFKIVCVCTHTYIYTALNSI